MIKNRLTERQRDIILMLPGKNDNPITISNIAKSLNLSDRTVKRDLLTIEQWFDLNDFNLSKKPGVGIFIDEDSSMIQYIYELLKIENIERVYQKPDRIKFILSRLLSSDGPIKYYVFTNYLKISDKTLNQDLIDISDWLEEFNIKLVKKQGEGISIIADEKSIRKAQVNLIYENLDDEKRIEIIRDISEEKKLEFIRENDVFSMINKKIVVKVKKTLDKILSELSIKLSENSYLGLVVHISLAVERIKIGEYTHLEEDKFFSMYNTQEYIFAEKITRELESEFSVSIPRDETIYISMHIKGANIIVGEDSHNKYDENLEEYFSVLNIIKAMKMEVESKFSIKLDDERLERDLKNHLMPAINRLKMSMKIRNPILEEIKKTYRDLFDKLRLVVPTIIYKYTPLDESIEIPDDEIGFLTIHFAASIERSVFIEKKIRIVTACPTGIGTSRLISSKIEKRFRNIEVVDNVSILNINKNIIEEEDIDLIVSTVDIGSFSEIDISEEIPYIVVSTILNEDDFEKIRDNIKCISRKKVYSNDDNDRKNNDTHMSTTKKDTNDIKIIFDYSVKTNRIFEQIRFFDFSDSDDICVVSSEVISFNDEERKSIQEIFRKRFDLGGLYLDEFDLYLVHGKSSDIGSRLAFGRSKKSGRTAIVMLADEGDNVASGLFSSLSVKLVEDEELVEFIRNMEKEKLRNIVWQIIEEGLKRIVR